MNNNLKVVFKNLSYTLSSNLLSFFISTLVVIIVPKLIGIEEYGYWQLYIFYSSYVGFLQFGWTDGIYLRYGGEQYKNLNFKLFFSQFWMLTISQLIISVFIFIISQRANINFEQKFIFGMISMCLVFTGVRAMILFLLQATSRIKDFANIMMLDRVLYFSIIVILLVLGARDYKLMIIADLMGKIVSLTFAVYLCKDIVIQRVSSFYFSFSEMYANISVGIKLMFANIASILILGIVRFGIERAWDVATFGKISLTLSISNMMMIFINAVGIIMFPILRRTNQEKLASIYSTMRDFLMVLLLGILIVYYPLKTVMAAWLPQYAESLLYMALVFPMFIYEGKMALLINTYLKTLRREKVMLRINLISMFMSIVMTYITTQIFVNLDLAILNIVILLAIRSALAESYLAKELNIKVKKDIFLEVLLTLVFILTGWFVNSWMTVLIYGIAYMCYLVIKRKDIIRTIHNIKSLIKS